MAAEMEWGYIFPAFIGLAGVLIGWAISVWVSFAGLRAAREARADVIMHEVIRRRLTMYCELFDLLRESIHSGNTDKAKSCIDRNLLIIGEPVASHALTLVMFVDNQLSKKDAMQGLPPDWIDFERRLDNLEVGIKSKRAAFVLLSALGEDMRKDLGLKALDRRFQELLIENNQSRASKKPN